MPKPAAPQSTFAQQFDWAYARTEKAFPWIVAGLLALISLAEYLLLNHVFIQDWVHYLAIVFWLAIMFAAQHLTMQFFLFLARKNKIGEDQRQI